MKNLFMGCLLLSTTSIFACEVPSEMSCKSYSVQLNSCAKQDQALAKERSSIIVTAFEEGRSLSIEEKLRRSEISNERLALANTLESLALEAFVYFDNNIAEVVNDSDCKNI